MSDELVATIEIKPVRNYPQNFYILILGGNNGIVATGSTIPAALRTLADKITEEAERAAVPKIIEDAIERSAKLNRGRG